MGHDSTGKERHCLLAVLIICGRTSLLELWSKNIQNLDKFDFSTSSVLPVLIHPKFETFLLAVVQEQRINFLHFEGFWVLIEKLSFSP